MPDDRIKISALSAPLTISDDAKIPISQENGGEQTTFGAEMTQVAVKVGEGTTFSDLETESKYIVPSINELKTLISQIPQFDVQVVQTLPVTGVTGIVYLVPAQEGSSPNLYEEYLWVNNQWEKLGAASVDLSNYYNKTQVNGMLADEFSTSESYEVGDYVIRDNYLYRCISATSGTWDSSKWAIVKATLEIPKDINDLDNVNIQNPTHRQGLVYDNPTQKWVNGTVDQANQLATSRTIALGTGATGTATSFNGTSNITIPVTEVKESYLTWGGKVINDDISPIDAACIDEFGHNKLAFLPAECINVAYSTDRGNTWTDYGLTNDQKIALVTTTGPNIYAGGPAATPTVETISNLHSRVRIASCTLDKVQKIYTYLKKIVINFGTNSTGGCKLRVRYRTIANYLSGTETWVTVGTYEVSGNSGWNSIPCLRIFGGNPNSQTGKDGEIELEWWAETAYGSYKCMLKDIRFIGTTNWVTPSELARSGHLYTMDAAQNATFPAHVSTTASPTANDHLTNKAYVDSMFQALSARITELENQLNG